MKFRDQIFEILKSQPEKRFTYMEIAQCILERFPDECEKTRSKSKQNLSSNAALLYQLGANVAASREDLLKERPEIRTTEGRPRKYYFSVENDGGLAAPSEIPSVAAIKETKITEYDLYPVLYRFLQSDDPKVYARRIDEKKSSNKGGKGANHWLHPDLVGLEILDHAWEAEVRECTKEMSGQRARLWSFEVKLRVERWNVRESFFQAVSNSSWAHFGYLVAGEFEDKTLKELRMLSAAHGIGVIQLDIENATESQILIPAREHSDIDWDAANRLAAENTDFHEFLKLVKQFHKIGEVKPADWPEPKTNGQG